ncbi:MAG: pyruvate kinase [Rhodocyclaceae bacterium]|nr:pyruvate kinase [Rhodocyclaceae bacterium]MDZ4216358.1 pyruvate kinase [Rhodocyclaceae bacterium]
MKYLELNSVDVMATIGPTLETAEGIALAIDAGAGWFRFPTGYRNRDHIAHALLVREVAESKGTDVKILFDLPSERLRLGRISPREVAPGVELSFFDSDGECSGDHVGVPGLNKLQGAVTPGHRVLALDGRIVLRVLDFSSGLMRTVVERGSGRLQTSNSVVFPDSSADFSLFESADVELLRKAEAAGLVPDWIALSMVTSVGQFNSAVAALREFLPNSVRFMAKLETREIILNSLGIVQASDGIMVARGDLGLVVEPEDMPQIQERLVEIAKAKGKPVIVATQFLENFASSGVPQRCELTDLATAAWQGASGIMLGKETVFSDHPIESIELATRCLKAASRIRLPIGLFLREPRNLFPGGSSPLIAIEGGNGVGKTTLIERLRATHPDWTIRRGVPDAWMEPQMKMRMIRDADWMASAFYFFSGSMELKRELMQFIQRQVSPPKICLDRSLWSTLAVQVGHDPKRLAKLMPILELMGGHICVPNKTVVLTASPETLRQRVSEKELSERVFDELTQNYDYWERESAFYHWLREAVAEVGLPQFQVELVNTDNLSSEEVVEYVGRLIS